MQQIELILKNPKLRRYQLGTWLLAALNMIVLFIISFTVRYQQHRVFIYVLLGFIFLLLLTNTTVKFKRKDERATFGFIYLLIMLGWISWDLYWAAALNLVFYVIYIYAVRKFDVLVSSSEIIYPSFPKRKIQWSELQNIILKDGILTIDFKNNKIIQNETEENNTDEKKFNEFCRMQLTK